MFGGTPHHKGRWSNFITRFGSAPPRVLSALGQALALVVLTAMMVVPASSEEQQRRVLFLYPNSEIPSATSVSKGVQEKLEERPDLKIQVHREFLELSRFPGEAHRKRLLSYLADKYASAPPHVVFALGSDSLRFAIDNRSVLAPAVPIVFCCASPATLASIERPSDVTGIVSDFDISKTVDLARRLQPNAREIVVIAGAAPFDLRWAEIARQQLAPHDHVQTRFLVGLPRETVLSEVAQLHRDSTVIMLTIFKDGAGRDFVPADIAAEVASASSAPIYAPYAPWVGRGFVGGHSDTFEDIGTQTGDLILRALDGEDMSKLPPLRSTTQAFRVDARQLERWGLSETSLPPDTIVMFRKASIWQEHRNLVLGVIGVVLVLSAASALLLLQMSKRRRAERELRQSDERLNFAAASAGIGLWQYDPRADHLWSSEHCRAMFGLPADTPLTTEALINAVHPNDRRLALAAVRAATFGHLDDAVSEFRVVDAKGHDRWLEARGRTSVDHHAKLHSGQRYFPRYNGVQGGAT